MSERTAQRYMSLAKASQVADLDTGSGLRQAYIACGIIPEPIAAPKPLPELAEAPEKEERVAEPVSDGQAPSKTRQARQKALEGVRYHADALLAKLEDLPEDLRQPAFVTIAPLVGWIREHDTTPRGPGARRFEKSAE